MGVETSTIFDPKKAKKYHYHGTDIAKYVIHLAPAQELQEGYYGRRIEEILELLREIKRMLTKIMEKLGVD